jgi:hypothetical protein
MINLSIIEQHYNFQWEWFNHSIVIETLQSVQLLKDMAANYGIGLWSATHVCNRSVTCVKSMIDGVAKKNYGGWTFGLIISIIWT